VVESRTSDVIFCLHPKKNKKKEINKKKKKKKKKEKRKRFKRKERATSVTHMPK
jgi:hypothetical protein